MSRMHVLPYPTLCSLVRRLYMKVSELLLRDKSLTRAHGPASRGRAGRRRREGCSGSGRMRRTGRNVSMNEVVIWGVGGEEGNEGEGGLTSFKLHMLSRHFCTKAGLFH
jgi:hypothetical protein